MFKVGRQALLPVPSAVVVPQQEVKQAADEPRFDLHVEILVRVVSHLEKDGRTEDPQYLAEVKFHDGDTFPLSVQQVNKALSSANKASFASLIRKHPVADVKKKKSQGS